MGTSGIAQHFIPIGMGKPLPRPAQFDPTLVERLNRLPNTSETVFDELQSVNFLTGVSGFRIQSDGTAEFQTGITLGGGVSIEGDLLSGNWESGGGSNPANLASGPDTSATTGYYLDHSAGAAQFQSLFAEGGQISNLTIPGTLTIDSGAIVTDSSKPRWRMADSTTDSSVITSVFEHQYADGDEFNAKVAASEDIIGLFARVIESTSVQQSAVYVSRVQGTTAGARVTLTNDQGYNSDSTWIEFWDPGATVKAQEFGAGTDYSASNLGAGRSAFRFWNMGDGGAVEIYGNPTSAEEVLNVFKGTPISSETKLLGVNNQGITILDDDDYTPNYAHGHPADVTTGIVNNAYTTLGTITLWDHTGTDRSIVAQGQGQFSVTYTGAAALNIFILVGISLDGGSTYSYSDNTDGFVGRHVNAGGTRIQLFEQHQVKGVATGDVLLNIRYYVVGSTDPTNFSNVSLMGHAHQLH